MQWTVKCAQQSCLGKCVRKVDDSVRALHGGDEGGACGGKLCDHGGRLQQRLQGAQHRKQPQPWHTCTQIPTGCISAGGTLLPDRLIQAQTLLVPLLGAQTVDGWGYRRHACEREHLGSRGWCRPWGRVRLARTGAPRTSQSVAAGHVRLEVGRLRQRPAVKDRAVDAADHLDTTVMRLSDVSLFVYRYAWWWAGTRTSCKTRLMCQCVCNGVLKLLR